MRAVLVLSCLLLAPPALARDIPPLGQPVPYPWETPEQTERRFQRLRDAERTTREYEGQFPPSDVAECRAQGNAAFGPIQTKIAVMYDCLEARRLRRRRR